MLEKYFLIITFLLFFEPQKTTGKCLIHNSGYQLEYLFSAFSNNKHKAHTIPLSTVTNYESLEWTIIYNQDKTAVYIKHTLTDQYLCSSNIFHQSKCKCKKRRIVWLYNHSHFSINRSACEWHLEKVRTKKLNKNKYTIWSMLYHEPLYAVSSLINGPNKNRSIFLWHGKPDSSQFIWNIDCNNGEYQLE